MEKLWVENGDLRGPARLLALIIAWLYRYSPLPLLAHSAETTQGMASRPEAKDKDKDR